MKRKQLVKSEMSGEVALKGKPVSASRSEMTEIVLPAQTNPLGKLLGGQVMHLVDMVAAMAAHRHSNSYVVTASVDYIDFRNPVNLGEIVNLKSQVNRVFRTSMEVGVEVYSENAMTEERKHTTSAYVTFVAIDEHTQAAEAGGAAHREDGGREAAVSRGSETAQSSARVALRQETYR